ncbi:hypothetical protein Dimus_013417, partial [Dionaea muscipula]
VVSEKGGGHVGQSFHILLDPTSGVAKSSEAPKKVVMTKRTKKATSEVADVGEEEEAPTEEAVGGTQESEVVVSRTKPKLKAKPKKKDVVSLAVGENVVGEKEGDEEANKSEKVGDERLQVRKRRRLRRATLVPVAEAGESEETESDEDVQKLVVVSNVNKEERIRKRR